MLAGLTQDASQTQVTQNTKMTEDPSTPTAISAIITTNANSPISQDIKYFLDSNDSNGSQTTAVPEYTQKTL